MESARAYDRLLSLGCLFAAASVLAIVFQTASSASTSQASPAATGTDLPDYTGAGSCASTACHGSKLPRDTFRIRQNEHTIWSGHRDRHSRALETLLSNDVSRWIQHNLGRERPASEDERCLDCHALNVPPERRAKAFQLTDGVSCEACHGPAERWLGPHTLRDWTHEQSLGVGMTDTKDLAVRARTCLGCHLGDERRQVDHPLIAAGHPDLVFELDTFCATMPAHWKEKSNDPWFSVRLWAVGQGVALEESMKLLARRSRETSWPEFADFDCFACHHGLVKAEDSYRIKVRGYAGVAGRPTWNSSRYAVFSTILRLVNPAAHEVVNAELDSLKRSLQGSPSGRDVSDAALRTAAAIEPVVRRLANPRTTPIGRAFVEQVIGGIATDAGSIADAGYRAAEQAALAIDVLHRPYLRNVAGADPDAVKQAVDRLFESVGDPNLFRPDEFAEALQAVRGALRLNPTGSSPGR